MIEHTRQQRRQHTDDRDRQHQPRRQGDQPAHGQPTRGRRSVRFDFLATQHTRAMGLDDEIVEIAQGGTDPLPEAGFECRGNVFWLNKLLQHPGLERIDHQISLGRPALERHRTAIVFPLQQTGFKPQVLCRQQKIAIEVHIAGSLTNGTCFEQVGDQLKEMGILERLRNQAKARLLRDPTTIFVEFAAHQNDRERAAPLAQFTSKRESVHHGHKHI